MIYSNRPNDHVVKTWIATMGAFHRNCLIILLCQKVSDFGKVRI